MKTLMMLLLTLLVVPGMFGQTEELVDKKTRKQLLKEERKRQEEILLAEQSTLVDRMVNTQQFVLEADYLSNQYGTRIIVSSTINFICVDSTKGTIQIASMSAGGGPNGMGGITADGMITRYEVNRNARTGVYNIEMMIMTSIGSYDIFLTVSRDGSAYATIGGNWGGKLNYQGRLVPLDVSRVFKGRSI